MNYTTTIDTVGIQIDFDNHHKQRDILNQLLDFIIKYESIYLEYKEYRIEYLTRREYYIYNNSTIIATINTGSYRTGSYLDNSYKNIFYISIKFAGLKRYNTILDQVSNDCLENICSFFNRNGIVFKLTELDVCIDIESAFENVLAICTKRTPKTKYYRLTDRQAYDSTSYIEKIAKRKLKKAVLRAYTYNKSLKENLDNNITRFELKLQPKYFNSRGVSVESIQKALDRYHVMYFRDLSTKYSIINAYNSYKIVRKREIKKLRLDDYRLLPNMEYIKYFIDNLFTIYRYNFEFISPNEYI
jgi:hypothetical protein